MRTWRAAVLGIATLAMVACGGKNEYPAEFVESIVADCTADGNSEEACRCLIDMYEEEFTFEEIAAEGLTASQGDELPSPEFLQKTIEFAGECGVSLE